MNTRPHSNFLCLLVCLAMFSTAPSLLNSSSMTHISQGTPKLKLNSIHHETLRGLRFLSLSIGRGVISLPLAFCSYNQEGYGNINAITVDARSKACTVFTR
jgi:hypothetical protein